MKQGIFYQIKKHMIDTKTQKHNIGKKRITFSNLDIFSLKVVQFRPIFLLLFVTSLMIIFYLAVLNPAIIFSIITGLALFMAGFFISNLFYLSASGKKEDDYNRMIIKNSSDLFLVFRIKDGRFKYGSPNIKKLLGYDLSSVVNKHDLSFVHPSDRFSFYNILNTNFLRLNRTFTTTLRVIKRDGETCWIKIKGDVTVNASNELQYVIMNVREVTKEKEQEITQQQYQKSLEQSIQKDDWKEREYEKIADLMSSYDLKEPLRTISSYSRLVQQRYADKMDKDGKEFLQYTVDGANRMARMMDDILSFSNVRMDKLRLRKVSTEKAIREVKYVLNHELRLYDAQIVFENLPEVNVDFTQFKELFKNLIKNALKFRSEESPVIQIGAEPKNGNWIFSVKDNGIGISKVYHHSIFDVFGKIKGSGKTDGTGIGLAVCKKIVTNHGGKIWVASNGEGRGSTFCFTIPAEEEVFSNEKNNMPSDSFQPELTFSKLKLHM